MKKYFATLIACWGFCLAVFANPAQLTVRMSGYQSDIHKNFAVILIPDFNYPHQEFLKISEDGTVQVDLDIPYTREIAFSYQDQLLPIIISPGDQVELKFDINALLTRSATPKAKAKGLHKVTNELIFKHMKTIDDLVNASSKAARITDKPSVPVYQSLRMQELEAQLKKLKAFIAQKKISDTLFISWANAQIRYAASLDLIVFPFMGVINRTIDETNAYFDFIKDFTAPDKFVASTSAYCEYLKKLIPILDIIADISEKHAQKRDSLRKNGISNFQITFNILVDKLEGAQLETALTNLFLYTPNIPADYIDTLGRYIPVAQLKPVETDKSRSIPIAALLKEFPIRDTDKKALTELYQSAQGKVVFHDFWFLNCAPCMQELPHYNALIEQAGPNVEFVFIGVYMEEQEWKDAIQKYQLKGRHILLNQNQLAFFERYFMVKSFPHHRLVDSQGLIIDNRIPGISPKSFELILQLMAQAAKPD